MNMDTRNYTKVRFRCNFIAPLLTKMYTDPNFLFGFKLCYVSRYLKDTSQQNIDTGNTLNLSTRGYMRSKPFHIIVYLLPNVFA